MVRAANWDPEGWVPSPALPLTSSVTLGRVLHLSELLLSPLKNDTVGQHGSQRPLQF